MKPSKSVGIVGYGAYVPRYRLPISEVSRIWQGGQGASSGCKSVAGMDEDTVTMSIEAARNALKRAGIVASSVGAVWVGSESHPYAVKPTSVIVAEAIGAGPQTLGADWQFACKAGTEAMQAAIALVGSEMARYAIAIGMDTAQGRPGDALEYTAAAGGAAYVLGPAEDSVAILEGSYSFVSDTPDFWRRTFQHYPQHAGRFTGQPAYYRHTIAAAEHLMEELGHSAADYDHVVFHQPNASFPARVAGQLGFKHEQFQVGLLAAEIGNAYAGSSMIGLSTVLDVAEPGQRLLQVSFGSGAGSDAFSWLVGEHIGGRQHLAPTTRDYLSRRSDLDYAQYVRMRAKLHMH